MSRALMMQHDTDPKIALMGEIDISSVEVFHNQILIGVYVRPNMTKSGILLADQTRKEDEYQGKVGLVLKKGPMAFVSDSRVDFKGQDVQVGDWVVFRASDGWQLNIGDKLCRMLTDMDIKLRVGQPDLVF